VPLSTSSRQATRLFNTSCCPLGRSSFFSSSVKLNSSAVFLPVACKSPEREHQSPIVGHSHLFLFSADQGLAKSVGLNTSNRMLWTSLVSFGSRSILDFPRVLSINHWSLASETASFLSPQSFHFFSGPLRGFLTYLIYPYPLFLFGHPLSLFASLRNVA